MFILAPTVRQPNGNRVFLSSFFSAFFSDVARRTSLARCARAPPKRAALASPHARRCRILFPPTRPSRNRPGISPPFLSQPRPPRPASHPSVPTPDRPRLLASPSSPTSSPRSNSSLCSLLGALPVRSRNFCRSFVASIRPDFLLPSCVDPSPGMSTSALPRVDPLRDLSSSLRDLSSLLFFVFLSILIQPRGVDCFILFCFIY